MAENMMMDPDGDYDKSPKSETKSGGNLKMGLSSKQGMGAAAAGDAKDDYLPKGGGGGSAKRAGMTFNFS